MLDLLIHMVIQGEYLAKWPFSNCKPPLKFIMNSLKYNIIYALLSLSGCVLLYG